MSELLKKQNYGVEVEFTGITRAMAAKAVAEVIGSTVTGPDHTCYHTRIIRDSQGRKWKIMRDSSIIPVRKTGRSPILSLLLSIPSQLIAYIPGLSASPSIVGYFPQKGQGLTPIFSAYFFNIIPTVLLLTLVISLNVIRSSMIRFVWIEAFWISCLQLIYIHLEYLIYIQLHGFAYHSNIPHHISKLFFQVFNM